MTEQSPEMSFEPSDPVLTIVDGRFYSAHFDLDVVLDNILLASFELVARRMVCLIRQTDTHDIHEFLNYLLAHGLAEAHLDIAENVPFVLIGKSGIMVDHELIQTECPNGEPVIAHRVTIQYTSMQMEPRAGRPSTVVIRLAKYPKLRVIQGGLPS